MEFLPLNINGRNVYAGFWKRFCAGCVDALIIAPLAILFNWLGGFDHSLAIAITIVSSIVLAMYNVFFNARFGGTLGKLAVGIRITRPDGSRIGWPEAWKRSAVDLAFSLTILIANVWGLTQVDPEHYASLGWIEQAQLVAEHALAWYWAIDVPQQVWVCGSIIVLLLNKHKRALHDFIAGTVVVQREFAERVSDSANE